MEEINMKRFAVWTFALILLVQTFTAQTTFHGNIARTGKYESPEIRELKGVKWKFKTDAPIIGSPAISNGVVFVGSVDTFLYAIDQVTGQLKWKFETNGSIDSSPAVADGLVYFGTYEGLFYAVDEKTGTLKWKFAMEYERRFEAKHLHGQFPKTQTIPDDWDFYLSSPAVFNDRVYFGSGDKNVYALNAQTGDLVWKFATKDVVHASRRSLPTRFLSAVGIVIFTPWMLLLEKKNGGLRQVKILLKAIRLDSRDQQLLLMERSISVAEIRIFTLLMLRPGTRNGITAREIRGSAIRLRSGTELSLQELHHYLRSMKILGN